MKPATAHSNLNLAVAQPACEQIVERDDSPLARNELRDEQIDRRGELTIYAVCF
jgi:hypothetical protein